jgi:hypothetical protein
MLEHFGMPPLRYNYTVHIKVPMVITVTARNRRNRLRHRNRRSHQRPQRRRHLHRMARRGARPRRARPGRHRQSLTGCRLSRGLLPISPGIRVYDGEWALPSGPVPSGSDRTARELEPDSEVPTTAPLSLIATAKLLVSAGNGL